MSNNDSNIQFPVALKPLLTNFVVNVLRDRIPSDQLPSYAAEYFSARQNVIPPSPSTIDGDIHQMGTFLSNQDGRKTEKNEGDTGSQPERRHSVWGGSPVEKFLRLCSAFLLVLFRILIEI